MHAYSIPGFDIKNHRFKVPLNHDDKANTDLIEVFVRELTSIKNRGKDLPAIVYFQGGPGFEAYRPKSASFVDILAEDYRVLLLDQRGTGLSTPFDLFLYKGDQAHELAQYLSNFRADQIIRDAEHIRREMGISKWSVLGQSYGGFCILSYLSYFPDSIKEAFITGGIPPALRTPKEVYQATHKRALFRNQQYFQRFPQDQLLCQKIVKVLADREVYLPDGSRLSPERFQQLGFALIGASWESLHYILEMAFPDERFETPSLKFLHRVQAQTNIFEENPIYAILHESIYCQGQGSRWAAWQVRQEFPEFDAINHKDFNFTGEVIYPFMFDQYQKLAPFKEVADILAAKDDWPPLYDVETLKQCQVPSAAAVYEYDIAVEREFSLEIANLIPGMKVWCTNEYEHDGLRVDTKRILKRLRDMCQGLI
ncbi:alpha/beta fold hydrolase [Pseudobacteriovorax antillogorgiicola]|uniref:Prolyl aminopeptidase 2. Serine peptidase. MEROPS family S33 n=1 Tax=Pseudobacteriovorax antillogorgiicola TaxID=1513793 RepID=A0A1Y6CGN9_9BACT|nr:alpha/beta fold hydrolase [Pseudobacteriovorax antillogorgiicola]TCS46935.1 prolyl aminopeptidase 2 [Pseudobacteriovorax antillogorgiicola]SMF64350.1 prolyl aminopeptidase 2. Serine peptidase. MEROPS family S33 [Pseudobacteriovorax antillogorgiicola]